MILLSRRDIPNWLNEGSMAEQTATLPARHLKVIANSAHYTFDIHHYSSRSRTSVWELGRRDCGLIEATSNPFGDCAIRHSCKQNLTL